MITIATIVIAALLFLLLARSFRIVQQGSVGVVKRLGRFQSIRPSGVTLLIPFVDNITHRIEIVDIAPPEQILKAMALQKTADQEKRAAILLSEGQQQSAVNVAEGAKQAAIKNAEGERQSQILRAEGQKQAAILEAEGRSRAIDAVYAAIHQGHPNPELLAVLQLDTLSRFATSPNAKIVVPFESAGLMGAAQALRSVLDAVPNGNHTAALETLSA